MKLFKVIFHYICEERNINIAYVLAGNNVEAERIVEEEIVNIKNIYNGIQVSDIEEVDMKFPQLLYYMSQP